MPLIKSTTVRGSLQALSVSFLQSAESVILPVISVVPSIFLLNSSSGTSVSVAASMTVLIETFTLLATFAFYGFRRWKTAMLMLRTPGGRLIVLSVLCGTVTGNLALKAAILLGGSSYGTVLSSLYPLFSILAATLFLHERYVKRAYVFMVPMVLFGALFAILPAILLGESEFSFERQGVAIVLSLLSALFWAVEGLLIRLGMLRSGLSSETVIQLRSFFSLAFNAVLLLPLSGVISGDVHNPYTVSLAEVAVHWEVWLIAFALGVSLLVLRIMHTSALHNIGSAKTAVFDSSYLVLTPLLALVVAALVGLAAVPGTPVGALSERLNSELLPWWSYLIIVGIIGCMAPTAYYASKTPHTAILRES